MNGDLQKFPKLHFTPGEMLILDFSPPSDTQTADEMYEATKVSVSQDLKTLANKHTYFITLTCTLDYAALEKRLKSILKSQTFCISEAYGCIEFTKERQPHVHMLVRADKYIDKSKLKRFNKDFVTIARPKDEKNEQNCLNYITKDETKPSSEYLNKIGIKFPYFIYKDKTLNYHAQISKKDLRQESQEMASKPSDGEPLTSSA